MSGIVYYVFIQYICREQTEQKVSRGGDFTF